MCSSLTLARLDGQLDADTAPSVSPRLRSLAAVDQPLLIELDGIDFCDCAGLNLFLRLARISNTQLVLVAPSRAVQRVMHLMGCDGALAVADSLSAALDRLTPATTPTPRPEAQPATAVMMCGGGMPR